jgi:2-dehydropantoate 2-reductase
VRLLIVGTGSVGLMHGWALSEAGVDVTHVVRAGTLGRHEGPVEMDVFDLRGAAPRSYRATYRPRVVDEVGPRDDFDLVMVATSHLDAAAAVRAYRGLAETADFLLFTSNWDGVDVYDELLGRERYLWGFSVMSGARDADGVLWANVQKSYRIGELDGAHSERLQDIVDTFALAGLTPDEKADIIEWQWVHFAIDAGVLGTALYLGGLPALDAPADTWVLYARAVQEALAVLEARGVDIAAYPDCAPFLGDVDAAAARVQGLLARMPHYARTRAHSHVDASREEMRRFCLDVLDTGRRLGVTMPVFESFAERI